MTTAIERPDWGGGTALVPAESGGAAVPVEAENTFANPDVERRYRTMVASRMAKASLPANAARGLLDPALVAEWESSGGVASRLAQAQKGAISILERLDPEERAAFVASFDGLPEAIRSALFSEISLGSTASVRAASDADMGRFASTTEGRKLVDEWGHRSNRNVAVIRDRIARILARMSGEDVSVATDWFDALPPTSAAAIYRMLVAK
jgi:hypothetical protein